MKKSEIAESLGLSLVTVSQWAGKFVGWLDVDPRPIDKIHDEKDCTIFRIIQEINAHIPEDYDFAKRMAAVESELRASPIAMSIFRDRSAERTQPETVCRELVSSCNFEYGWLAPLSSDVNSIADFGCWVSEGCVCPEFFALLWILKAKQIVVIEKELKHINNAKKWNPPLKLSFFDPDNVIFVQGDMRDDAIAARYAEKFELAFCYSVLYYMQDNFDEMQTAINTMKRVVKPGGWLIAIEGKITDMSHLFEPKEWEKVVLPDAPDQSYCYRKKVKAS